MCKHVIVTSYSRDGPAPDYRRREAVPDRTRPKRDGSGALARWTVLCWVLVEVQTPAPVTLSTLVA